MANLPEKLIQQRLRLIHQSLDSPSNLPGSSSFRSIMETGVSPMTGLAMNLSDASLGMTPSPIQDSKRRLSLDDTLSSSDTPSPMNERCMSDSSESSYTPLSSIGNKPTKRILLAQGPATSLTALKNMSRDISMEENKENLPLCNPVFSPCKIRSPLKLGRSPHKKQSPAKILRGPGLHLGLSPIKPQSEFIGLGLPSGLRRSSGVKRPMFTVLEEDDTCSRDSGYNSQGLEIIVGLDIVEPAEKVRKKSRSDLDEMLADCSPGKEEEGIAPLANSPKETSAQQCSDGFDLDQLPSILEDSAEMDSPRLGFSSLLSNKLVLPQHLASVPAFSDNQSDTLFIRKSDQTQVRPMFRRALSMQEPSSKSPDPSNLLGDSPLSRTAGPLQISGLKPGFKRPDPPTFRQDNALGVKKRRFGLACRDDDTNMIKKPSFVRSHSLNELSIMKSCQLKEEVENILPDSSRLYALPTISAGSKHPSLRSITCETLNDLVMGKHNDLVETYRVVDVRYKFEYDGGHIVGAENWQHGEDDAFLSSFLPSTPLASAPTHNVDNQDKRRILIFHCEFSSQRGPDFYMKLRERDRQLNKDVYPGLHYPECYLLHLGYKEFFRQYPSLCTGTYTQMTDPRHESDLRKMRAKSKSWSGGTVARTGRMGRLHL